MNSLSERALIKALEVHQGQTRKVDGTPFVAHPIAVAFIVARHAPDEEIIAAALLHDALEDTPYTAGELEQEFGARVRAMVESVTIYRSQGSWEERKRLYLDRIPQFSPESRLICCADKIHNLVSMAATRIRNGASAWRRFGASPGRLLWFHEQAYRRLAQGWQHPLLETYAEALETLRPLVAQDETVQGETAGSGSPFSSSP